MLRATSFPASVEVDGAHSTSLVNASQDQPMMKSHPAISLPSCLCKTAFFSHTVARLAGEWAGVRKQRAGRSGANPSALSPLIPCHHLHGSERSTIVTVATVFGRKQFWGAPTSSRPPCSTGCCCLPNACSVPNFVTQAAAAWPGQVRLKHMHCANTGNTVQTKKQQIWPALQYLACPTRNGSRAESAAGLCIPYAAALGR